VRRLFLANLFLWAGFLLVVVPWSVFWDRNYFAQTLPALQALMGNYYVRGAISGLGLLNVYFGLAELVGAITSRPSPPTSLGASSVAPRD
jgi:hypothetical protein